MTLINRFSRLRCHGIFRDFLWPSNLPEFTRYNLIYGWNATGKTTLTRLFRQLEESPDDPPEGEVVIKIDGTNHDITKLSNVKIPIKVFNRDFQNENVFQRDGGMAPIFVLGKENVEKQKEAERLKGERSIFQNTVKQENNYAHKTKKELDSFGTNSGSKIKEALRSPGPGKNPFNNYNRRTYVNDAEKMINKENASALILDHKTHDALLSQVQNKQKETLELIACDLPDINDFARRASELFERTVLSEVLEALRNDGELSTWVQTGFTIHQERNADKCLFCNQPLPHKRVASLEKHFSNELKILQNDLDTLVTEVESAESSLEIIKQNLPKQIELDGEVAVPYESARSDLLDTINSMHRYLNALKDSAKQKRKKPFDHIQLLLAVPVLNRQSLETLNSILRRHNTICDEYEQRVDLARRKLADNLIASTLDQYQAMKRKIEQHKSAADHAQIHVDELDQIIRNLEAEIQDNRAPAEELNDDLFQYFGHREIQLRVQDNGYLILRSEKPVGDTLCEGERTAIALLYFLKSLNDRRFSIENGIVVLDDPVSSLDSIALFSAFAYIREHTERAGQVFILTHNFTLFRHVKNWFENLKTNSSKVNPATLYMIQCQTNAAGERASAICKLDRLLLRYESEYLYLFARMYKASIEEDDANTDNLNETSNLARRVLETFLAFRLPNHTGSLRSKIGNLQNTPEAVKTYIMRFLVSSSYKDPKGALDSDPTVPGEGKKIMQAVVALMNAEDPSHTNDMIERTQLSITKKNR